MTTTDNGTRYLIHKTGTPKIQRAKNGGIEPSGLWWQDTRPNCGQWVDREQATTYATNRAELPTGGEWVAYYLEISTTERESQ
jgi:hypothetical protein